MANEHVAGTGQAGTFAIADTTAIRIRPEVDADIALVEPAEAPLDTLLRLAGRTASIKNPVFNVQEESPIKNKTTMLGAEAAGDTTLDFADASFMVPTLVGKNIRTGEQFYLSNDSVITVATGAVTNCIRGFGTTPAAAMVAGDLVVFTSTALEEGQDKIQSRVRSTGSHQNFAQMIEHDISISEQNALLGVFGVGERERLDAQGILEYRKMRNRALLLNEPVQNTAGTQVVYATGGLRYWASQFNNANVGPGVTYDVIAQALSQLIRHGGGVQGRQVWGLTSQKVWNIISGLKEIRDLARTTPDDDTVGFEVSNIKFPGGMMRLAIDHNLEDFDEILAFDLNFLEVKQLIGTSVRRNVQTPGAHREEWQIYSQEGLAVKLPLSTMRLYGMEYAA